MTDSTTRDAAQQDQSFLTIEGLWKAFGNFVALKDISLEIQQGEFICFLGPSGCGKTTLLRAIAGLDIQSRGSVAQDGKDISSLPPAERDFGIVFQSYALFPNLTIEKNIAFGLENIGMPKDAIAARVAELLELVGLPEQGKKYPAQLSGGQQQRIALARAIASKPGLLLLDEPLSALDAKVRVSLRHEIKELQRKLGVTTIMVTHDQEEGLAMGDRIVVMNHGVVEQIGTPTEIYRDPESLFVADFIGEMNQVKASSTGNDGVMIGKTSFKCIAHNFPSGTAVIAAIRPEDIIPHGEGARSPGAIDVVETPENMIDVEIVDMEFLGSFWRAELSGAQSDGLTLVVNFSVNAIRRMELGVGKKLSIEIPLDRLKVFPLDNAT
ncbi:putative 2-aminoethylphosphonate ABC transporter ATP-binding protein [Pararhizobium sp. IMCC21322]|uniref:putative 2-aminoethylphosphonate ABC transporter ATP-binding protein n=1 Tax=Pararhizobium sp. IMCC21322 TaxID=3067903 RepID=UPI002740B188|nr:putative 2-aminoethylphosphonate ABC transporter ATP-binding protein [Pararhizobium sp. IMCC21322]